MMVDETTKQLALDTISDLAIGFLSYSRRDDEELSEDDLWKLFSTGKLTVAECAARFGEELTKKLARRNF